MRGAHVPRPVEGEAGRFVLRVFVVVYRSVRPQPPLLRGVRLLG